MKEDLIVSKKRKKRGKKRISKVYWGVLVISILILLTVIALVVHKKNGEKSAEQGNETQMAEKGIEFPYAVEGTGITIKSLSQASVPNPDSNGELVDDIACVEVENTGETYISNLEISLKMQDGTEFNFKITDMPAGTLVQAFDVNNTIYDEEIVCEEIKTENLKEEKGSQLMEDAIQISVDETIVTLTNITGEPLENLSIVCHCDMDGSYFGGCSYTYNVESISAGGSIDLDASDCYLGQASVVRILKNN